jgi:DNA-directed RNA polymerase subunit RPC12/RpoP
VRCLSCNYDLKNLSTGGEHRCPECGRKFDPKIRRSFLTDEDTKMSKDDRQFWVGVLIGLVCLSTFVIFFVVRALGRVPHMP